MIKIALKFKVDQYLNVQKKHDYFEQKVGESMYGCQFLIQVLDKGLYVPFIAFNSFMFIVGCYFYSLFFLMNDGLTCH